MGETQVEMGWTWDRHRCSETEGPCATGAEAKEEMLACTLCLWGIQPPTSLWGVGR